MIETVTILIGDDHELVRDAIAHVLRSDPSFSVGVASDVPSVIAEVRDAGGYDVILLDVDMPGMDGLNGVEAVVRANPEGAVVIFSGQVDNGFVWRAVEMGAKGYIPKTFPMRALPSTIRVIASGQVFIPLAERQSPKTSRLGFNLTDKERLILRQLSLGRTNKEIARNEEISETIVKMHMRAICAKLGAKNRTHAAMIAKQISII